VADEKKKGGKRGRDRADHLHEVIDHLKAGPPALSAAAPTGHGGESLREAIHRRMHELDASEGAPPSKQQPVEPDDDTS